MRVNCLLNYIDFINNMGERECTCMCGSVRVSSVKVEVVLRMRREVTSVFINT